MVGENSSHSRIPVAFRNEMALAGLTSIYENGRTSARRPFIVAVAQSALARQK